MPWFYAVSLAYSTVLLAELGADKSLYTVSSLAMRFRPASILAAAATAFGGKMLVATLVGRFIGQLPERTTATVSAAGFLITALVLWIEEPEEGKAEERKGRRNAFLVSFSSLFFTEWGDPGQIAAAAIAGSTGLPLAAWLGGTLACLSKACVALGVGAQLRRHIPHRLVRAVACGACMVLAVAALVRVR